MSGAAPAREAAQRLCSRCDEHPRRRAQRWCNPCFAAYMRAHRPKFSELPEVARRKAITRSYSRVLLRRGKLLRKPCRVSGCRRRPQMHHPDYTNPRRVVWICRSHHLAHHRRAA